MLNGGLSMAHTDIVRAALQAFREQARETATRLLADDYVFTSPQDDHISKAAFMERCFPTASRFASQEIVELAAVGEDGVFLLYEYQLADSEERYRNAEFSQVRDGQLTTTQVFFGGSAS
jgi:ketosteroid isomerase-like protein